MKITTSLSAFVALSIKACILLPCITHVAWGNQQAHTACPAVEAIYLTAPPQTPRLSLAVLQHALVIQEQVSPNHSKSHRVSFQKPDALAGYSEACAITPIALIQGGDWGWHVLWQTEKGIFYARVDGEAWVSSVPKHLAEQGVDARMVVDKELITVEWKTGVNAQQAQRIVSVDEGRSWN